MFQTLRKNNWDFFWNSKKYNTEILKVWAQRFYKQYNLQIGFKDTDIVLDFGAGSGEIALSVCNDVCECYVYDRSQYMKDILQKKIKKNENIFMVEKLSDVKRKPNVIIVNSVVQYLQKKELEELIVRFKNICLPGGKVILSDILPENYSKWFDFIQLIKITFVAGILKRFISHALRTTFNSPMQNLISKRLSRYDYVYLEKLFMKNGFSVIKLPQNMTYSRQRYTLLAHFNLSLQKNK